ncbi:hypothetical protein BN1708_017362, partial [Verticillium longisporum]
MIDWFDDHIGLLALNLISLVVNDNNGLVVRFAVVIEAEEKSDQRVLALQEALKDHKEMATRFQSITDGAKKVRGYKDKFLQAIKINAEGQFGEARGEFLDDPSQLSQALQWYFNDLNAVKIGMTPLMPKKWRILKTYGQIYHELMHDFLLLRHPDDLDKIIGLKQEFGRKKSAVDGQLRSGLREQLETTQSGMTGLADGQKAVQQIKEEMMKIDRLCSESQNMIKDFTSINIVSQAHRNFGAVRAMRKNLETFNE